MLLRGIGIVIVASACCMYGFFLSSDYLTRIQQLEQINKGLLLLKGEITYNNESIGIALIQTGKQLEGVVGQFYARVADYFKEKNSSIQEAWNYGFIHVMKEKSKLTNRELVLIEDLGNVLGVTDRETQINCILNQMEKIQVHINELKKTQAEKCRLYRTMGIMLGAFVTILLI